MIEDAFKDDMQPDFYKNYAKHVKELNRNIQNEAAYTKLYLDDAIRNLKYVGKQRITHIQNTPHKIPFKLMVKRFFQKLINIFQ